MPVSGGSCSFIESFESSTSKLSPSPLYAGARMPLSESMGSTDFRASSTSACSNKLSSAGISVASSLMLLLAVYALTSSKMSLGSTCFILSLLTTMIGDMRSSSAMRSANLLLPRLSVFTLYICDFASCIRNILPGSKSTKRVCGFMQYLILWPLPSVISRTYWFCNRKTAWSYS